MKHQHRHGHGHRHLAGVRSMAANPSPLWRRAADLRILALALGLAM